MEYLLLVALLVVGGYALVRAVTGGEMPTEEPFDRPWVLDELRLAAVLECDRNPDHDYLSLYCALGEIVPDATERELRIVLEEFYEAKEKRA